jgi:hypothetical protein
MGESKRIAVIGIHGVGDHPPFATAREIGDLLSDREYQNGLPRYAPFTENVQRINVRPVKVAAAPGGGAWEAIDEKEALSWGPLDQIAKAAYDPATREQVLTEVDDKLDHLFMRGQLAQYVGDQPEDTYQLLRLEGERLTGAGEDERLVHIYEMFWSDLSTVGNAAGRIFGELYQLLFHLVAVGANNVKAASIHFQKSESQEIRARWQWFDRVQNLAAALLAWPIAILSLFMAAIVPVIIALSMMRSHLSAVQEAWALEGVFAVIAVGILGAVLSSKTVVGRLTYALPLAAVLAIGAAIGCGAYSIASSLDWHRDKIEMAAAITLLAAAFVGVYYLLKFYDKSRPGSTRAGVVTFVVYALASAAALWFAQWDVNYRVLGALFTLEEAAFLLLMLSWWGFYLCCLFAHLAGGSAMRAIRNEDSGDIDAASRTRWTAQLTLALSSVAFTVLTVALWAGFIKVGIRVLPGQDRVPYSDAVHEPCPPKEDRRATCTEPGQAADTLEPFKYLSILNLVLDEKENFASRWVDETIDIGGLATLPFLLAAMTLVSAMALWALLPSVLTENDSESPRTGPVSRSNPAPRPLFKPESLGNWLSSGFRYLRSGGKILYWMTLAGAGAPAAFYVVRGIVLGNLAIPYLDPTLVSKIVDLAGPAIKPLTEIAGTLVAGAAVGLIGFGGSISKLAFGFRPVLKVGLDVDNWLREHPLDSNPTARICGRYVSLLRHILAWKDGGDSEKKYTAIVIVAHSQGTVITADLLRFLNSDKYDPELQRLFEGEVPVYLFTMGCPLRQLYSLRFPFLYGWARGNAGKTRVSLGVQQWINAYRSGDYIGRCLWPKSGECEEWAPMVWGLGDPPPKDGVNGNPAEGWMEFCIGSGAHTHYWDFSAAQIAEVLDQLIQI